MIRIYINNDFEANITSLMSNVQWANVKFFPEPTGELYGWLLTTLVTSLAKEVMLLVALVCLSVWLAVDITQKVINRLG